MARALDELGDAWTLLLLRTALLGVSRFHEFEASLAIPPTTLTRRLEVLTAQGYFERTRYDERPPRDEYALTEKGLDVLPILLALSAFGNRWLAPNGAPLECVDPVTGRRLEPVVTDRKTGVHLTPGTVAVRPGPGASQALRRSLPSPVLLGVGGAR